MFPLSPWAQCLSKPIQGLLFRLLGKIQNTEVHSPAGRVQERTKNLEIKMKAELGARWAELAPHQKPRKFLLPGWPVLITLKLVSSFFEILFHSFLQCKGLTGVALWTSLAHSGLHHVRVPWQAKGPFICFWSRLESQAFKSFELTSIVPHSAATDSTHTPSPVLLIIFLWLKYGLLDPRDLGGGFLSYNQQLESLLTSLEFVVTKSQQLWCKEKQQQVYVAQEKWSSSKM